MRRGCRPRAARDGDGELLPHHELRTLRAVEPVRRRRGGRRRRSHDIRYYDMRRRRDGGVAKRVRAVEEARGRHRYTRRWHADDTIGDGGQSADIVGEV